MMPPIYNERVLPAKLNRQILPPITADTSQIHKLIEEQYSKTIVLPETRSTEVFNVGEQPELLPQILSQAQPTPAPIMSTSSSIVTNSSPMFPTSSPIITNSSPMFSTSSPIVTTSSPIVTTPAPITTSVVYQPVMLSFIPSAIQPIQQPILTQSLGTVGSVGLKPNRSALFQPILPRTITNSMTYNTNSQFGTQSNIYGPMNLPYSQRTA